MFLVGCGKKLLAVGIQLTANNFQIYFMKFNSDKNNLKPLIVFISTVFALIAFASNSVLCRLALGTNQIDAASFSTVRIISGAIILLILALSQKKKIQFRGKTNLISAFFLFLYAVTFSFAYISLSTATGALILFGAVQITMIVYALKEGERPNLFEWVGLILALSGLVYLMFPGLTSPSIMGSSLMTLSGISWGVYSLIGRRNNDPLKSTSENFLFAVPFVIIISLFFINNISVTSYGFILAVISGSVTSGIGYAIWYVALRGLTATRAATVQLSVPIIAAIGGIIFMSEIISFRLLIATILILGGVGLAVLKSNESQKI